MKNIYYIFLSISLSGCAYPLVTPLLTAGAGAVAVAEDTDISYDKEKGLNVNLALPSKEDFKKLFENSTKSEFTQLFFESSNYYLESQELLFKAYDMDLEAKKVRAAIDYAKNSKLPEKDRMMNSMKVSNEASSIIRDSMDLESESISNQGKEQYNKALNPALKGVISTVKLVPATSGLSSRLANPVSAAMVAKDLGTLVEVLPRVPAYIATVASTMKLIVGGARAKGLENTEDLELALVEL